MTIAVRWPRSSIASGCKRPSKPRRRPWPSRSGRATVIERLDAGEDFATLAQELSLDTGSGAQGGDLGWFTYGRMVPEFSAAAFSLTPGEVSEPVKSDYGYHIIKVEAHEQDRPVDEADMAAVRREHFDAWLELQVQGEGVERLWTSDMVPVAQGYGG